MRKADAVEDMEHQRPEQSDLAISLRCCRHIEAKPAPDGKEAADDHLAEFVGFLPPFAIPDIKGRNRRQHAEAGRRIDGDHPAGRQSLAKEGQLELRIRPDEIGVENLLVGDGYRPDPLYHGGTVASCR